MMLGNDVGGGATAGVGISVNDIQNNIIAKVADSTLGESNNKIGSVALNATNNANITAYAIILGAGVAGGKNGAITFTGVGVGTQNKINNTIEGAIENSTVIGTTTGAIGAVSIIAQDMSSIIGDAGGVGLAIAGSTSGGSGGAIRLARKPVLNTGV